jgi:peptidyl-prolyl cis-trans isomerase C
MQQCNNEQLVIVPVRFKKSPPFKLVVTMLVSAVLLAGCEHKPIDANKTQVVARVNGKEITIHEVNQYIQQLTELEGTPEQIKRRATDAVIDQNLLLQAAKKAKIDRDPDVLQALLGSDKNVLVQAYLARQFTQLPPPTEADIEAYYRAHPLLFGERKLYQLDQLEIQASEEEQGALITALRKSATVGDFIKWLKTQHMPFDEVSTVKAPEDMSAHEQAIFLKIKIGEAAVMKRTQETINITVLSSVQPQPVALDNVRLKVGQMLTEAARQQKIATLVQGYRHQAKIEYAAIKE